MNTLCVDYDINLKSIAWIGYDEKNYFTSTSLQQFHLQLPSIPFLDIKISIKGNSLCTSVYFNLQIHIVTCCIYLRIHITSRIPYLFHGFSDFVVYVVTTLFFPKNQRQCAKFSRNVAILFLNSIPFSRFLRLHCLCSDDSVFSEKF